MTTRTIIAWTVLTAGSGTLVSANTLDGQPASGPPSRLSFKIDTEYRHVLDSNFDEGAGSVEIDRLKSGIGVSYATTRQTRLAFDFSHEHSWYEFDGVAGLVPGDADPLYRAYQLSAGARFLMIVDREWSWFVGGGVQVSAEEGGDLSEGITGFGIAGARYQMSPTMAMTFGFTGTSRLEEDFFVLPILGVDWDITDRVTLSSQGPGLELSVDLDETEEWVLALSGSWQRREYRLDDDGGPLSSGIFQDARVPVELSVTWSPSDTIELVAGIGGVVYSEYEFKDDDGDEVADTEADAALYVRIGATISF